MKKSLRTISIPALAVLGVAVLTAGVVFAAPSAIFTLKINPGNLAIDVVDSTYATVAAPVVAFDAVQSSLDCGSTTGILGTAEQQIYITNPDANDNGYTVALAPSAPIATAKWSDGDTNSIAVNDETAAGCTTGQMTVTAGTITDGKLTTDLTTGISAQGGAFSSTDSSVTLVDASASSADISEVVANGFSIKQTIPARTPAADYSLPMTLTIIGK